VAERTDRGGRHRLSISADATERELRLCGFALLNHYLTMHRAIAEHVQLAPVELLILIATTTGNVQRSVRLGALPKGLRGTQPLPVAMVVPISRRAIARITGIPKETVRRHVDGMVERGILLASPQGVRAPSRLAERWAVDAVLQLLESHAACTERLFELQALTPRAARATRSKGG
jgi:hypothetical protein